MIKIYLLIFCITANVLLSSRISEAAGAVNNKKRQQQQQQDAVTQQILNQRNQAMQAAQQQMAQQRQAQQRAAEQQAFQQRQQTIYQEALGQRQAQQQAMQVAAARQAAAVGQLKAQQTIIFHEEIDASQIQDTTTIAQIWKAMERSSEVWLLMMENDAKALTVTRQIDLYKQQEGVTISKDPAYYVQMIDGISAENPSLLNRPFKEVLRFVAILEYDFDNGEDKDTLALKLLGDKMYEANKTRLGL